MLAFLFSAHLLMTWVRHLDFIFIFKKQLILVALEKWEGKEFLFQTVSTVVICFSKRTLKTDSFLIVTP